jgi:hypothetical protein
MDHVGEYSGYLIERLSHVRNLPVYSLRIDANLNITREIIEGFGGI